MGYIRWKRLLITIMTIVMPEDDEAIENDVFEADEDVPEAIAYDATYSKLHFATNQVCFGFGPAWPMSTCCRKTIGKVYCLHTYVNIYISLPLTNLRLLLGTFSAVCL